MQPRGRRAGPRALTSRRPTQRRCAACHAEAACEWCGGCGEGKVYRDARLMKVPACGGCVYGKVKGLPVGEACRF